MIKKLIGQKMHGAKLLGQSNTPLKYSSAGTRYASLQSFCQGAEFNEENFSPEPQYGSMPEDYIAKNIRSGQNVTDCPSVYGSVKYGLRKIGGLVFTPENDFGGWLRKKGEPCG